MRILRSHLEIVQTPVVLFCESWGGICGRIFHVVFGAFGIQRAFPIGKLDLTLLYRILTGDMENSPDNIEHRVVSFEVVSLLH